MEKQLLKKVNPEIAARELTRVAETVTCLECCKFYIVPETATCGHTLCHVCWIGQHTCPVCALPLKKRALRQNAVIKTYTECVQKVMALFEKQFNMKMEELAPEPPIQNMKKMAEKDPSKTVNAWLCDSQNQFSAPVSTQLSTQVDEPIVEVKTCEIQVHTGSKKTASPTKVIHAPAPPQDDWDKIESIPDTEELVKNKENVGPNIDPFFLEDDEYTQDHPRRSSRKRDHRNESKPSETSTDKHSSCNLSVDTTEKLSKYKQNWSNVKKMRKEFSKLHKKNKNKLNVSIEMCKKTKSVISNATTSVEPESQKVIEIEDFTPKVDEIKKSPISEKNTVNNNNKHENDNVNENNPKNASNIDEHSLKAANTNQDDDSILHKTNSSSILNNYKNNPNNKDQRQPVETEVMSVSKSNIPFPKKSGLQSDKSTSDLDKSRSDLKTNIKSNETVKESAVQTVNHVVDDKVETDSDDIQITIKIGNTVTNIFIKKKKNDVKVKLNTDQEAQTLQCMEKATSCNASPSSPKTVNVQNIEINIGGEGVVSAVTQQTKSIVTSENNQVNLNKTDSTKKDTASAETIPIQISASFEKELTKIMESNMEDDKDNDVLKDKTQEATKEIADINTYPNKEENKEEIELDEDMFASGSVQENVQLLKATKPAPSEILMPTFKKTQTRKQTQTQKQAEKRMRENDEEINKNKKIKVKVTSEIYEDIVDDVQNEDNKDESSINYDSVMGQVFATIDADMGNTDKSQSIIEINEDKTLVEKQATQISQHSQLLKTQQTQRKVLGLSKVGNTTQNVKSNAPPKDSESLFALSNIESQTVAEKGQNQQHGPETQAHIANLLTPGMCRDLASSRKSQHVDTSQLPDEIPATPQDRDDSDASVCEETPQKDSSYTRKSAPPKPQSPLPPDEAQLIKDIINISDSEKDFKNTTTIKQFCNQIQYNSTPVARKSLNFGAECESPSAEFTRPLAPRSPRYCVATSCLSPAEVKTVELLCAKENWTFVKEYTKELTHLVVGVDEHGRSQRTVKFMCALAAGRWIVRYEWANAWLRRGHAAEESFEALDFTGEPGPERARTAARKLFDGFTFFCMPPFSVLSEPVLKMMLESAGGLVAGAAREVCVQAPGPGPGPGQWPGQGPGQWPGQGPGQWPGQDADVRLLLAEPEHTQENQFTYLALELNIVPVNYEWALNCLGSYTLTSILDLMLCPSSLLPAATSNWPPVLIAQEFDTVRESD